jgi:hypothetical protein
LRHRARFRALSLLQCGSQTGLSDARLACQDDGAPLADGGLPPSSQQRLQFLFAPHQRRQRIVMLCESALNCARPDDAPRPMWLNESLRMT